MAVDLKHYAGREQAFVKHTFLDEYLKAALGIICSRYDEFVYIDGFAGPWKSAAGEDFDDTSFGIALKHMTKIRDFYEGRGRLIKMRAFLVEKDASAYRQLEQAIKRFPKIEFTPLKGMMEDYTAKIAASIPSSAFTFTLIDPKGFPEIGAMMPLLRRQNAEALVNFMFDFANRFGGTDLISRLEAWLSLAGKEGWRDLINGRSGVEREQMYEDLAVEALRATPGYAYAPVITVDKVLHNRPLYKLIFLSRHSKGLEVFRNSEGITLGAQAEVRSVAKANRKAANSAMGDLFADGSDAVPNDRSSQVVRRSQEQAPIQLTKRLIAAGEAGMTWGELWPQILEDFSVTRPWLGRQVNDFRKAGQLLAPGWSSERKQIPDDGQRLIWSNQAS